MSEENFPEPEFADPKSIDDLERRNKVLRERNSQLEKQLEDLETRRKDGKA